MVSFSKMNTDNAVVLVQICKQVSMTCTTLDLPVIDAPAVFEASACSVIHFIHYNRNIALLCQQH